MKKIILTTLSALLANILSAQSAYNAIIFSQSIYQGTSRSLAMGNAVGAMGNDFGSLMVNPAGMGLYRCRGEFTFTPAFSYCSSTANYIDMSTKTKKSNFNISNAGLILSKEASNYGALRYWQLGFGVNRSNNYNYNTTATGFNENSSIVDSYLDEIDGMSIEDIENNYSYLPAWSTYIIDTSNGLYTTPVPKGNLMQTRSIKSTGHTYDINIAGSLNFIDKVFLGATIGFSHLKSHRNNSFAEENMKKNEYFEEWTTTEFIRTSGWGINIKVGIIAYPARWLRIGLAYHSPTSYTLKETWEPRAISLLNGNTYESSYDLYTSYTYELITPQKFGANLAFIINDKGLVTTDYEYMNYGKAKFRADDYDYTTRNDEIKSFGKRASNIRIGTEWVINNVFVRGGFAFYGSPYNNEEEQIGNTLIYSAGIGCPFSDNFSIDLTYSLIDSKDKTLPYNYIGVNVIGTHYMRHNVLATLKLKW